MMRLHVAMALNVGMAICLACDAEPDTERAGEAPAACHDLGEDEAPSAECISALAERCEVASTQSKCEAIQEMGTSSHTFACQWIEQWTGPIAADGCTEGTATQQCMPTEFYGFGCGQPSAVHMSSDESLTVAMPQCGNRLLGFDQSCATDNISHCDCL